VFEGFGEVGRLVGGDEALRKVELNGSPFDARTLAGVNGVRAISLYKTEPQQQCQSAMGICEL